MNDHEILKAAIEKTNSGSDSVEIGWPEDEEAIHLSKDRIHYLIFSHEFAKAFWGSERIEIRSEANKGKKYKSMAIAWSWHLQMMVLEKNPIQYLKKFV